MWIRYNVILKTGGITLVSQATRKKHDSEDRPFHQPSFPPPYPKSILSPSGFSRFFHVRRGSCVCVSVPNIPWRPVWLSCFAVVRGWVPMDWNCKNRLMQQDWHQKSWRNERKLGKTAMGYMLCFFFAVLGCFYLKPGHGIFHRPFGWFTTDWCIGKGIQGANGLGLQLTFCQSDRGENQPLW